ncbi:MAG: class I SAM-dependent methyltransferase [Leucobacter sp.]
MTSDGVTQAYSARADEYVRVVGKIEHAAQEDRDYVLSWAKELSGPVLDVGCGPGQWTNFLHHEDVDIEGVDPVVAFIEDALARYPSARYRVASAEQLGVGGSSLGGVLAWYSLIHTDPDSIDAPIAEFARCIAPGGGLVVGFFDGPARESFDHAVTTAYYWSVDALSEHIERAGFTIVDSEIRRSPNARPHGVITAQR